MKKIIISLAACLFSMHAIAQSTLPVNGDFENWTERSAKEELNDWLTYEKWLPNLETASRSSESIDGNYSLKIESGEYKSIQRPGFACFGSVSVGTSDKHEWFPNAADSLVGWFKYNMQTGDSLNIQVNLKSILDLEPRTQIWKFGGNLNEWQRFALPIDKAFQDSILIAFATSSPGSWNEGLAGSVAYFDNISLKSTNASNIPDLPNYSFENWDILNRNIAGSWYAEGKHQDSISPGSECQRSLLSAMSCDTYYNTILNQTSDAHSGNFALRLDNIEGGDFNNIMNEPIPGNNEPRPFYESDIKPKFFNGFYKLDAKGGGNAKISISFVGEFGQSIPYVSILELSETGTYKAFSMPIAADFTNQDPSGFVITINNSNGIGSQLWLDDVSFSDEALNIEETNSTNDISVYPNPVSNLLHINFKESTHNFNDFEIVNSLGQTVLSNDFPIHSDRTTIDVSDLEKGIYFLKIKSMEETCNRRFIIN